MNIYGKKGFTEAGNIFSKSSGEYLFKRNTI